MIKYKYTIEQTITECLNVSDIPAGVEYEFFEYTDPIIEEIVYVPQIITRRQFKTALAVLGYQESDIFAGISQLPEPTQTVARISYTEAGTFERTNPELIFVAKTFLQLTDEQIDTIFITGDTFK